MISNHKPEFRSAAPLPSKRNHYPHIQDLIARTNIDEKSRATIKSWLEDAGYHWTRAKWSQNAGNLDEAYVEYLLAFTIVADVIPRCPEYATFRSRESQLQSDYDALRKVLQEKSNEFDGIKQLIKMDNEASGVLSSSDQTARPQTKPENTRGEILNRKKAGGLERPEVRAKPDFLSSKVISPRSSTGSTYDAKSNDIHARFQRLSMGHGYRPSSTVSKAPSSASMPLSPTTRPTSQPYGPREMPTKPPKLDMKNGLPKLPEPTYSPTTSYGSPGGLSPPRSSARILVGTSKQIENTKQTLPHPTETILSVEDLSAHLKAGSTRSVLLLDVRAREDYEQGHIPSRSIACIEPISLRDGISGEELEDTLVLGTSRESELLKTRDTFDLVVYYDQSTLDLQSSANNTLKNLQMALDIFTTNRPLKRPALHLAGGLDAWVDIFGKQCLQYEVSQQTALTPRQSELSYYGGLKDIARVPNPATLETMPTYPPGPPYPTSPHEGGVPGAMGMPVEPINIEEEKKWLEQLQKDNRPVTISAPLLGSEDGKKRRRGTSIISVSHVQSIEEYFQQYPRSPHSQESMSIPGYPEIPPSRRGSSTNTIIDHPFHLFTDVRNPEFNPPTSPIRPPPAVPRKSYSGVSERLATAAPVIPTRPPKIPIIPPQPLPRSENITGTGLKNLGNTCYMNSVLQCMSGTIPLTRYFLDGSYKFHINKDNPLGSRGVLAEAFATVIRYLWSGEYKFIAPITFKNVSGRLNETFRSNDQQDAQEFLEFLLDGLHEDLNPNATRNKLNALTEEEERKRERLPVQVASAVEWKRYIHENASFAVNWLQGQLSSRLRCLTCDVTSTTYSPFMYLSLPIPVVAGTFSLRNCLEEFTKDEVLDGDDAWNCPNCKKLRKATKKLTITRLPHILIIHLKRFTNQGRWRDKLNTPIEFPLTRFDMTGYVPPPLAGSSGLQHPDQPPETTPPFIYDLYGIVNHYGTLHGGHYTASVKNPRGTWCSYDDSKASIIDENSVVSRNAYVLFWVRKNIM